MAEAVADLIGMCCSACGALPRCDCDCLQCPNCDCPSFNDCCCNFACPCDASCRHDCCSTWKSATPSGRLYDACIDKGCCECGARACSCHWMGDGGCCGTSNDDCCRGCYCGHCYCHCGDTGNCIRNQHWGPGIGSSGDCDKRGDFCDRKCETCLAWLVCCPCTLAMMWGSAKDDYRECCPYLLVALVAPPCAMISVRRALRRRHHVRDQTCAMLTDCVGVGCCCPCVACQLMRASHYDEWCPCAGSQLEGQRHGRPYGSGTQQWAAQHNHPVLPGPAYLTAQHVAPPQGTVMGEPVPSNNEPSGMGEPQYSYGGDGFGTVPGFAMNPVAPMAPVPEPLGGSGPVPAQQQQQPQPTPAGDGVSPQAS